MSEKKSPKIIFKHFYSTKNIYIDFVIYKDKLTSYRLVRPWSLRHDSPPRGSPSAPFSVLFCTESANAVRHSGWSTGDTLHSIFSSYGDQQSWI
jgi:hypothetical protein